jgi:hypothetical protein
MPLNYQEIRVSLMLFQNIIQRKLIQPSLFKTVKRRSKNLGIIQEELE